jgi:replication initiation protein RepC
MQIHQPTTPFGRRPLTLAQVAAQAAASERPPQKAAHKWNVFRDICAAKARLGVSDRALAVLNALLSFHPETALSGPGLIVFPSNRQLSLRAHGMAPATLRRHLAALVEAGLVIRRDSPNGKRYARKGQGGEIEAAFGFDLAPLVVNAERFAEFAQEVRDEERALRLLRERVTLCRRDIAKCVEAAIEAGAAGWEATREACQRILSRLPRIAPRDLLEAAAEELGALAQAAFKRLADLTKPRNPSANESQTDRHLQNSKPNRQIGFDPAFEKSGGQATTPPLPLVLKACPDISDYGRGTIAHWGDLAAAAEIARSALGVSPSAYQAARGALGERAAAIAVAAILQRGAAIANPGGYLRALTRKAEANAFSVGPMLMALVAARERAA